MPETALLTHRDDEILDALTLRVRCLTLSQLAETWWRGSEPNARRRLRRLEADGLLERMRVNVHPLIAFSEPECAWHPRTPGPDFGAIAYRLQSRWRDAPTPTTIYIATKRAANQFGGFGGRLRHRTQVTHDLHLAGVFLHHRERAPDVVPRWLGEETYREDREGEKLPDAMIVDANGEPELVIEFGGSYDAARVQDFHEDCETRGLPYELW